MVDHQKSLTNRFAYGFGALIFAAWFGNFIIIFLILKKRVFKNTPQLRLIIFHTAVIDILSSIDNLTYSFGYDVAKYLSSNHYFCQIHGSFRVLMTFLTPFSILLLAIGRYYTTVKPIRATLVFSKERILLYIVGIFALSFCFLMVIHISNHHIAYDSALATCYLKRQSILGTISLLIRSTISLTTVFYYVKLNVIVRKEEKKFKKKNVKISLKKRSSVEDKCDEREKNEEDSVTQAAVLKRSSKVKNIEESLTALRKEQVIAQANNQVKLRESTQNASASQTKSSIKHVPAIDHLEPCKGHAYDQFKVEVQLHRATPYTDDAHMYQGMPLEEAVLSTISDSTVIIVQPADSPQRQMEAARIITNVHPLQEILSEIEQKKDIEEVSGVEDWLPFEENQENVSPFKCNYNEVRVTF